MKRLKNKGISGYALSVRSKHDRHEATTHRASKRSAHGTSRTKPRPQRSLVSNSDAIGMRRSLWVCLLETLERLHHCVGPVPALGDLALGAGPLVARIAHGPDRLGAHAAAH